MSRLFRKFGYDITKERILEVERTYLDQLKEDVSEVEISSTDWDDFVFTLRYRTNHYVELVKINDGSVTSKIIPLVEGMMFETIKPITKENHPWLLEEISEGEILTYHPGSMYGTVNRYQGLPLGVGDSICQINFDSVRLVTEETIKNNNQN